jgi:hypothetical protein
MRHDDLLCDKISSKLNEVSLNQGLLEQYFKLYAHIILVDSMDQILRLLNVANLQRIIHLLES